MKKSIPLTGSSPDLSTNRGRNPALAPLYRQILRTAQTHPSAHVRAVMQWMHDGNKGPWPKNGQQPDTSIEATLAPIAKAPETRRAPPARPAFKRPAFSK